MVVNTLWGFSWGHMAECIAWYGLQARQREADDAGLQGSIS